MDVDREKEGCGAGDKFVSGICAVCGWRGCGGVLCSRRCSRRYFYDHQHGLVRLKAIRRSPSQAQRRLYLEVRKWVLGQDVAQEVVFPWSIGPSGAGYRYDIAVPGLKLLVEYDSGLHRTFNKHFHRTMRGFIEAQRRDKVKNKMAKAAGWELIRVEEDSAGSELLARRKIERKCREIGG